MLVFVDESGDTGLKLDQGSSDFFTVALVVFEENAEAQAADERITLLRRELGRSAGFEFHFVHNSTDVRRKFLHALVPYNFFYFGYVIDKSQLQTAGLDQKEAFYRKARKALSFMRGMDSASSFRRRQIHSHALMSRLLCFTSY